VRVSGRSREARTEDVIVVAECRVDWLPADRGLSDPVQQDQWLAGSGSMLGELVGGGRRQAGRDGGSSVGGMASERRDLSNSHRQPRQPHCSLGGACGRPVTRASRHSQIAQHAMAAAGTCLPLKHSRSTSARYPVRVLATRPGARARQLCLLR
jgi:hypothetical protein